MQPASAAAVTAITMKPSDRMNENSTPEDK
jgi:hypothetical protein